MEHGYEGGVKMIAVTNALWFVFVVCPAILFWFLVIYAIAAYRKERQSKEMHEADGK
jgi:hypothetical protein